MQKKFIGFFFGLLCLHGNLYGQEPALASPVIREYGKIEEIELKPKKESVDPPGSNGWNGKKPYWVSVGSSYRTNPRELEGFIDYENEHGSPKTSFQGYDYNFSVGINLFSYLDISLEYAQTPTLMVQGKKGDQFTYYHDGFSQTYTFSEDRKIKLASYEILTSNIFLAVTDGLIRIYAGLTQRTVTPKLYVKPQNTSGKEKDKSFLSTGLRVGLGRFYGDFFPYVEFGGIPTLAVRYYF